MITNRGEINKPVNKTIQHCAQYSRHPIPDSLEEMQMEPFNLYIGMQVEATIFI